MNWNNYHHLHCQYNRKYSCSFVKCNLNWSGQLVRFTMTFMMQNDRDFIEVHSLELVGYLMQPFARTHNNATISPKSQKKKESVSPNVRYLNSYSCQLRCRDGGQSASKWANWCANTRHNYNIIQTHTRAVMANTHLQQHKICGIHISWSIYLTHLFTTMYHLSRLLSSREQGCKIPW